MTVDCRTMKLEDVSEALALSIQLGYPSPLNEFKQRYIDLSQNPDHWFGVATLDGKVVGLICARKVYDLLEPLSVEIAALVVDENIRGSGVGARLVTEAENWARSQGIRLIWLRSNLKRERAHQFYQRLGYPIKKSSHLFFKTLV